jgi:hypothetical protein
VFPSGSSNHPDNRILIGFSLPTHTAVLHKSIVKKDHTAGAVAVALDAKHVLTFFIG